MVNLYSQCSPVAFTQGNYAVILTGNPHMEQFVYVVSADIINTFKDRLDKFWANQNVLYDYKSDLHGIGNRSIIM